MKLIWTPRAVEDLQAIVDFIGLDSPDAAARVASRIFNKVEALPSMLMIGRLGSHVDTQELLFHPWPYIVVYRVSKDAVRILRVRHGAQNRAT